MPPSRPSPAKSASLPRLQTNIYLTVYQPAEKACFDMIDKRNMVDPIQCEKECRRGTISGYRTSARRRAIAGKLNAGCETVDLPSCA
jgi:hypothetical protein